MQRKALAKKFATEKMQLRRAKEELEEMRRGVEARKAKEDVSEDARSALGAAPVPASVPVASAATPALAAAPTTSALDLEVSETSRRMARELRKMEKRVETEKRKRESMQNEIKAAKREAKRSAGATSHVSHHAGGAAWVPSTSATPLVGEPGVASSERGGERWQRVRARADKRRREAEANMAMTQRRKVLIEQLKAEKRRQRKIEMQVKALRQEERVNAKRDTPAIIKKKNAKAVVKSTRGGGGVAPPSAPSATATTAPKVPPSTAPATTSHALDVMLSQELKGVLKRERDHMRRSFEAAADSKVIADEVESRIRDMVIEKATSAAVAAAVASTKANATALLSRANQPPARKPRGSKKRATTKAVSPKLGLSRAERIKARKSKESSQLRRQGRVKSAGTQSTPSLSRRSGSKSTGGVVAAAAAAAASPAELEAEAAAYAAASPAMSQLSMGSELDRTGDSSVVGMGFDEDFQTAGGWEELQELLAFHSPASSVKQRKQGSGKKTKTKSTGGITEKAKKEKVGSSRKQGASANKKKQRQLTGHKNMDPSSKMNVTRVTPGVPAPLKKTRRSGEKKKKKKTSGGGEEEEERVTVGTAAAAKAADPTPTITTAQDGILGIGVDFDARIEEQRRKWDEERLAFAERLKALQSGTLLKKVSPANKFLQKGDENLPEDDADNEADSSMDMSLLGSGSGSGSARKTEAAEAVDEDASDLLWLNKESLKMVDAAAAAADAAATAAASDGVAAPSPSPASAERQQEGGGVAHSGGSSQGSPSLSNDENLDLSRLNLSRNTTPQSKKKKKSRSPFSTPPPSGGSARTAPLSSPPPSLFKTDIVDRVVEQHSIREAASSVSTSLAFDSNSELDSDSAGDEQDQQQVSVEL